MSTTSGMAQRSRLDVLAAQVNVLFTDHEPEGDVINGQLLMQSASGLLPDATALAGAGERQYAVTLPEKLSQEGPWTVRRFAWVSDVATITWVGSRLDP
jgi:hypothetical protein